MSVFRNYCSPVWRFHYFILELEDEFINDKYCIHVTKPLFTLSHHCSLVWKLLLCVTGLQRVIFMYLEKINLFEIFIFSEFQWTKPLSTSWSEFSPKANISWAERCARVGQQSRVKLCTSSCVWWQWSLEAFPLHTVSTFPSWCLYLWGTKLLPVPLLGSILSTFSSNVTFPTTIFCIPNNHAMKEGRKTVLPSIQACYNGIPSPTPTDIFHA